jgi:hypothetical protein
MILFIFYKIKNKNNYKQIRYYFLMEFIALLSTGKGTWGQISGLIKYGEWDKIILVGRDFAEKFTSEKKFEFVKVDLDKKIKDLKEEFEKKLKGKIQGTEVALSIASGDGKEHMALISALLSLPVGIRFVALTKEGIIYL